MSNPAGALARLAAAAHRDFPALESARQYTRAQLEERRHALGEIPRPDGACVVLFGSWARQELTEESDDDWAVLVRSETDRAAARPLEAAARKLLGTGDRKPGSQDVFGQTFTCDELVAQVGLDEDTNRNLTRRMLLLLESTPLVGKHAHAEHRWRVLRTYLQRGAKPFRPPRFLLNDVIRYWRTVTVDFEGKHWDSHDDPKWVTRNAKLRTSRKVLFAGGLIPVLACGAVTADDQDAFLREQLEAVPTDRLAQAFLQFDTGASVDAGARGLGAYDRFVALMSDRSVRTELAGLRAATRRQSPTWRDIAALGDELQQSLISLLFGPGLGALAQQYVVF